jgi:TolB-like protein
MAAIIDPPVTEHSVSAIAVTPLVNNSFNGDGQCLLDGRQVTLIDALSRMPKGHVLGQ